jgi:hypothetical protein
MDVDGGGAARDEFSGLGFLQKEKSKQGGTGGGADSSMQLDSVDDDEDVKGKIKGKDKSLKAFGFAKGEAANPFQRKSELTLAIGSKLSLVETDPRSSC